MDDPPINQTVPALSIILPVYNVEPFIADCVDSIIGATSFREQSELVIIDDGSLDGSIDIARTRCAGLTNVTFVQQTNAGLGAARNAALVNARGRFVWFVDSDDEICPEAIAVLSECIDRHATDIIAFEFETIGGVLNRPAYMDIHDKPVDPIDFLTSGRPPSAVQFYAFSRHFLALRGLKFEQGIYHEDALFTPLALTSADSLVRLRTICYRYRLRPGSIMFNGRPTKHLADMMVVAGELGRQCVASPRGSRRRFALARELGFALIGVRYYWHRTPPEARRRILSISKLVGMAKSHWHHFSTRSLVNYGWLVVALLRDRGVRF